MTDRELLCLITAVIWGHVDVSGSTLTTIEGALKIAREIISTVDETLTPSEREG
jgi:hypothetical protein